MTTPPGTISESLFRDAVASDAISVTRLGRDDRPERVLRRGSLLFEVEKLAGRLSSRGFAGRPVLIPERNGLEYVVAFLACLRAGCMAVTAHPPRSGGGGERLAAIVRNSRPAAVIAGAAILESIDRLAPDLLEGVDRIDCAKIGTPAAEDSTDASMSAPVPDRSIPWPDPASIALLQYTSGSTRDPAPVALTQANLLANGLAMRDLFQRHGPSGGTVCWMPLYHDMGLIGLLVSSLLVKVPLHLMDPEAFAMRPIRWLRAMSNTAATYSGGPCFAYDLCVDRTTAEDRSALDLSAWKFAFNGAEPIRPASLARFQAAFGPCGFDGMMPCYGLAEHTLLVSVRRDGEPVHFRIADRTALDQGRLEARRTVEVDATTTVAVETGEVAVASCGRGLPGHEIVIRDPKTGERLADAMVGEITLKGPSVAVAYHQRPDATAEVFPARLGGDEGPWLRTGDLGSLLDGELHVLGRLKDLLIVDGRNVHPADVEASLEGCHPALSGGRVAVFASGGVLEGSAETVSVVVELSRDAHRGVRRDPIAAAGLAADLDRDVKAEASMRHGIRLSRLVVVGPGGIPRTTSGKIRRAATRDALLAGGLEPLSLEIDPC